MRAPFPTEAEANARLRRGMSTEEVISIFGKPQTRISKSASESRLSYLAPIGTRTNEHYGYTGFVVAAEQGVVVNWDVVRSRPSYEPNLETPLPLRLLPFLWGGIFVTVALYTLAVALDAWWIERRRLLAAFLKMDLAAGKVPADFAYLTDDTTLREVMEQVGPPARAFDILVHTDEACGYPLPPVYGAMLRLRVFEYPLPYGTSVFVMPEVPFALDCPIRAVYCRRLPRFF